MVKHKVIELIDEMVCRDWYKEPSTYYGVTKQEFLLSSYKTWALHELRVYVLQHPKDDPITCIENFRHMVDGYACDSKTPDANFMFSVSYDVATDVLDMLLIA